MGWLDELETISAKIVPKRVEPVPRQPEPECLTVHEVLVTVRPPRDDHDAGEIAAAFYTVGRSGLQITNEQGAPLGEPIKLEAGSDPEAVARAAIRQRRKDSGGFGRPIVYGGSGWR